MSYKFIDKVDSHLFDTTAGAWKHQLEANAENVSEAYYAAGLEFCGRIVRGEIDNGAGCVCAVVLEGADYASALVVVNHAKVRNEVRMLELYVQPELNLADTDPDYPALAWIAATAMIGCLELTYDKFPAKQLKLHTAFPLDKPFMSAIGAAIFSYGEHKKHYNVTNQGNWLVVEKLGEAPRLRLAESLPEQD